MNRATMTALLWAEVVETAALWDGCCPELWHERAEDCQYAVTQWYAHARGLGVPS